MKAQSIRQLLMDAEASARERLQAGQPLRQSPSTVMDAAKSEATVYIYDAIGGWFGIDPKAWVPEFNAIKAKTIHLRINSPGGSVFDAQAMKTAIMQHPAHVIAHIDGMAASAATGLAIAADETEMALGSMFMIHNAWCMAEGFADDLEETARLLRKCSATIADEYCRKTGLDLETVQGLMDGETWMTAPEALEFGFVDKVFGGDAEPENRTNNQLLNTAKAWRDRQLKLENFKRI